MTDARSAFEALDRLEDQAREGARDRTEGEPVTPEQHHEQFATELATRLRHSQSAWVTFTANP
jgi:hypothetical protein